MEYSVGNAVKPEGQTLAADANFEAKNGLQYIPTAGAQLSCPDGYEISDDWQNFANVNFAGHNVESEMCEIILAIEETPIKRIKLCF
jgi:hypothetical protein